VALVAASSQHRGNGWPVVATSLEPNLTCVWPWTTSLARCQSPCGVQFTVHTSTLPVYHGCGGRTRGGGEDGRLGQSNAAIWTKGTEPPWSIHPFVGLFIHSLLHRSNTTGISIINNFTVFDDCSIWNKLQNISRPMYNTHPWLSRQFYGQKSAYYIWSFTVISYLTHLSRALNLHTSSVTVRLIFWYRFLIKSAAISCVCCCQYRYIQGGEVGAEALEDARRNSQPCVSQDAVEWSHGTHHGKSGNYWWLADSEIFQIPATCAHVWTHWGNIIWLRTAVKQNRTNYHTVYDWTRSPAIAVCCLRKHHTVYLNTARLLSVCGIVVCIGLGFNDILRVVK